MVCDDRHISQTEIKIFQSLRKVFVCVFSVLPVKVCCLGPMVILLCYFIIILNKGFNALESHFRSNQIKHRKAKSLHTVFES